MCKTIWKQQNKSFKVFFISLNLKQNRKSCRTDVSLKISKLYMYILALNKYEKQKACHFDLDMFNWWLTYTCTLNNTNISLFKSLQYDIIYVCWWFTYNPWRSFLILVIRRIWQVDFGFIDIHYSSVVRCLFVFSP